MQNNDKQEQKRITKPEKDSINMVLPTPLGHLNIRGPVTATNLRDYNLTEGLSCFRTSCRQHQALIDLAEEPDGLVFIIALANTIIAYVTFQKPDYPWWSKRSFSQLIELGSIETDPAWRKMGISTTLMESIFKNPSFSYFEDFIVIAVQFIHSWDLKNTGLAPWSYRDFLMEFFSKYDFVTWETVDPEVREHPCNVLMARVGANCSPSEVTHFSACCLGTS